MDYSAMSTEQVALACLHGGDESAWCEFIRRFNPLIAGVALRVARQWGQNSPEIIDDLIQETYLKLCAERFHILERFRSDHQDAIYGFVKVFTANLVQDHFKASNAQKRGGSVETSSLDADALADRMTRSKPEIANFERALLIEQVTACLKGVTSGPNAERDFRIFWLYYRAGLAASAIASLPAIRMSTKGVESTILRLTRAVRQQLAPSTNQSKSVSKAVEGISPIESL